MVSQPDLGLQLGSLSRSAEYLEQVIQLLGQWREFVHLAESSSKQLAPTLKKRR